MWAHLHRWSKLKQTKLDQKKAKSRSENHQVTFSWDLLFLRACSLHLWSDSEELCRRKYISIQSQQLCFMAHHQSQDAYLKVQKQERFFPTHLPKLAESFGNEKELYMIFRLLARLLQWFRWFHWLIMLSRVAKPSSLLAIIHRKRHISPIRRMQLK